MDSEFYIHFLTQFFMECFENYWAFLRPINNPIRKILTTYCVPSMAPFVAGRFNVDHNTYLDFELFLEIKFSYIQNN